MENQLAALNEQQQKMINELEAKLGVVLIAYNGYAQENDNGNPVKA